MVNNFRRWTRLFFKVLEEVYMSYGKVFPVLVSVFEWTGRRCKMHVNPFSKLSFYVTLARVQKLYNQHPSYKIYWFI